MSHDKVFDFPLLVISVLEQDMGVLIIFHLVGLAEYVVYIMVNTTENLDYKVTRNHSKILRPSLSSML